MKPAPNSLRLLSLPLEVQKMVDKEEISAGHARALLALDSSQKQIDLAHLIIKRSLTVRDIENLASKENQKAKTATNENKVQFKKLPELSEKIAEYLQAPVHIKVGKKQGKVEIAFKSVKDLERIFGKIVGHKT